MKVVGGTARNMGNWASPSRLKSFLKKDFRLTDFSFRHPLNSTNIDHIMPTVTRRHPLLMLPWNFRGGDPRFRNILLAHGVVTYA
eukprot:1178367-Prorocentrum_minimum.AAC.2